MSQDPKQNKEKSSFSVAPSPFNELKLDALLWCCGGIILLLVLENLKTSNTLELVILFLYGLVAFVSIVVRAHRIVVSHQKQQSD